MATLKVVLYKFNKKKDGTCPLAIRIIQNRKQRYIFLEHYLNEKDWDSENSKVRKSNPNYKRLNNFLRNKLTEIDDRILEHETKKENFSLDQLRNEITGNQNKEKKFIEHSMEFLENLVKTKKFNRLVSDKSRIVNFLRFLNGKDVCYREIDEVLLKRFKVYLISERKVSERTVVNHFIVIRTLFNLAIKEGLVSRDLYPFGKDKIKLKCPDAMKIGLDEDDIIKIENLDLKNGTSIWHTRNVFLYSFYFAGMRISDVLRSKWSDFKDGRFYYRMGKNKKTDSIKLSDKVKEIINHYKTDKISDNDFIFPELKKVNINDPSDENRKINTAGLKFNSYLKQIAQIAEIDKKITNHIARHSFGNIAGDKVSPQMLQKLYRHSDIRTTMSYQSTFIHKDADEALDTILSFKKQLKPADKSI